MKMSIPSTFAIVARIIPWKHWTAVGRVLSLLGFLGGVGLFLSLFLRDGDVMWGMVLTFPTIAAGLAGGPIWGAVLGLFIAAIPHLVSLVLGMSVSSSIPMLAAAFVTFTFLCAVIGYVAALTISHRQALAEITELREILPMCAHCKRVRDDEGYWSEVEEYVSHHTGVAFSHGLCDTCLHTFYPEHAGAVIKLRTSAMSLEKNERAPWRA